MSRGPRDRELLDPQSDTPLWIAALWLELLDEWGPWLSDHEYMALADRFSAVMGQYDIRLSAATGRLAGRRKQYTAPRADLGRPRARRADAAA